MACVIKKRFCNFVILILDIYSNNEYYNYINYNYNIYNFHRV